jgi:hypothetical protein
MLVKELETEVSTEVLEKKSEFAKKLLKEHMARLDRARKIVAKLEADLEEFGNLDVADLDLGEYRY